MNEIWVQGAKVRFRPIGPEDAGLVVRWRNSDEGRTNYFEQIVVTPDSHLSFLSKRAPHDLVWVVEKVTAIWDGSDSFFEPAIGIQSLKVDINRRCAEDGRTFIKPEYRGQGLAIETELLFTWYAFEVLNLDYIWAEIFVHNEPIRKLHVDRLGWEIYGTDVPGHTNVSGSVHLIHLPRAVWFDKLRGLAIERGWSL